MRACVCVRACVRACVLVCLSLLGTCWFVCRKLEPSWTAILAACYSTECHFHFSPRGGAGYDVPSGTDLLPLLVTTCVHSTLGTASCCATVVPLLCHCPVGLCLRWPLLNNGARVPTAGVSCRANSCCTDLVLNGFV